MDFESIESILRMDSTDQIQIRILGIHDLSVSLRKDLKKVHTVMASSLCCEITSPPFCKHVF